jgi:hypothetical protein
MANIIDQNVNVNVNVNVKVIKRFLKLRYEKLPLRHRGDMLFTKKGHLMLSKDSLYRSAIWTKTKEMCSGHSSPQA